MKYTVHTSIDISESDNKLLSTLFDEEFFKIENTIYKPGLGDTAVIINFVLSTFVGGIIYDLIKAGLLKLLTDKPKLIADQFVISIKQNGEIYKIHQKGNIEINHIDKEGKHYKIDNLSALFEKLDKEMNEEQK